LAILDLKTDNFEKFTVDVHCTVYCIRDYELCSYEGCTCHHLVSYAFNFIKTTLASPQLGLRA